MCRTTKIQQHNMLIPRVKLAMIQLYMCMGNVNNAFKKLLHKYFFPPYRVLSMTEGSHDDVMTWKHFPDDWPFVRRIHQSSQRASNYAEILYFFLVSLNKLLYKQPGLYSLSSKMSYRQISWSLKVARFRFRLVQSLWNLTGTSAAILLRCLSNFRAMQ